MKKHIVQYSGGVCSFFAALRVIQRFGTDTVVLLFADTLMEDEDLYRFLEETAAYLKVPITYIRDGRNPWQVFKDERYIGNTRADPCSKILKRELMDAWVRANATPDAIRYFGLDWTETERLDRLRARLVLTGIKPEQVVAPMADWKPVVDKPDMLVKLNKLGIKIPRLYAMGFAHNNCFTGDEKFITSEGLRTFEETVGQEVKVLGTGTGWKTAQIKAFGKQPIVGLILERLGKKRVILTTSAHRWFVRKGRSKRQEVLTAHLREGDKLYSMYARLQDSVRPSAFAIAQGIVFGDGCAVECKTLNPAHVTLCGLKDRQLLKWFPNSPNGDVPGVGIQVRDLPRFWKQLPPIGESKSFLYGWLAGYFAADGSVSSGQAKLSSSKRSNLEFVESVCLRLGLVTDEISEEVRLGLGVKPAPLYSLALVPSTLRSDFFLIEEHRRRFDATAHIRPVEWTVKEVVETGEEAEVFCAVVPDGHVFTLERNILTSNCGGGCCKAGQAQWRLLLATMPERYKWHEEREEELRQFLGKDVSILRDRRGGEVKALTLRAFRERIQGGGQHDRHDWGGCGCAID